MSRKNSVKQRIVDTASSLFYNQGFNNTGINQIVGEAGIAIGSLYKHYRSKNDLLYSYLEIQELEFFSNLNECLGDEKNPKEKLLKLINYRIQLQKDADFSGCHFIKINAELGRKDERVNELVVRHKEKQKAYLYQIVEEIGKKQILPLEPVLLTDSIFFMLEGALVSAAIHGNSNDLEALKEIILQMF